MIRATSLAMMSAALVSAPAGAAELGSLRTFGDWVIGCDNGRACHAVSLLPADEAMEGWFLRLDRAAAATAPVHMRLMPQSEIYPRSGAVRLRAGGAEIARLTFGQGIDAADDGLVVRDRVAIAAVIAAIHSAPTLDFLFEQKPSGGDVRVSISLAGAKAALLRMDDLQYRLDTVTALVRRGGKSADAVPTPPVLPTVVPERKTDGGPPLQTLAEAARAEMIRQSAGYCDDDRDRPDSDSRNMVGLGPGLALASVPCISGAYNFGRAYFVVEDGATPRARPALFPRPIEHKDEPDREAIPDNVLWNADFAANSTEISQFSKGRGFGDCGETGVWRWDGQRFQAVSITLMNSCRGVLAGYWPQIFASRNQGP